MAPDDSVKCDFPEDTQFISGMVHTDEKGTSIIKKLNGG